MNAQLFISRHGYLWVIRSGAGECWGVVHIGGYEYGAWTEADDIEI